MEDLYFLTSISKLGSLKLRKVSTVSKSPKSTSILIGSDISSTILKFGSLDRSPARGFSNFNNNSCLAGSLFNKALTPGIKISFPKLSENSLK